MSALAGKILNEYELAREHVYSGFQHLLKAGELLNEVELLVGAENLEAWLNENCSEVDIKQVKQSLHLFKGEKIQVQALRSEVEKELNKTETKLNKNN